jgi:hypothetical protein
MKNSTSKNTATKKQLLGQYNTPVETVVKLFNTISDLNYNDFDFVEPSFGSGNIIKHVKENFNFRHIFGFELDSEYKQVVNELQDEKTTLEFKNFYDVDLSKNSNPIFYFGNPPFRTPNESSKTHPKVIKKLKKKYSIKAIKEEAVFFILHTIDISPRNSQVYYILPKTIFQNPTKAFEGFKNIFKNTVTLKSIIDIDNFFGNVDQDLVLCHFVCERPSNTDYSIIYNSQSILLSEMWVDDVYTYNDIFKKTYLGSVPTESIFLSCKNESLDNFKQRMETIFNSETIVTEDNLVSLLSYNGLPHLGELKKNNLSKIRTVISYINEVKNNPQQPTEIFSDKSNYKTIKHRLEERFYFRHESLKKYNFVYLINPNPGQSFYFTGNPTKISTDYFGYTDYDVNRNSSPGAVRTVPIDNIEENLTDEFKTFWKTKTKKPFTEIFEYLLLVSKSDWWTNRKKKLNKQYFCIPKNIIIGQD